MAQKPVANALTLELEPVVADNLARYLDVLADRYLNNFDVVMVYRTDRYGRGGDQVPVLEAGYPAVRVTEAAENYDRQHQDLRTENGKVYGDTIEGVDFANQMPLAQPANGRVARHLADGRKLVGDQRCPGPEPRSGCSGFGPRMTTADDDDVERILKVCGHGRRLPVNRSRSFKGDRPPRRGAHFA